MEDIHPRQIGVNKLYLFYIPVIRRDEINSATEGFENLRKEDIRSIHLWKRIPPVDDDALTSLSISFPLAFSTRIFSTASRMTSRSS